MSFLEFLHVLFGPGLHGLWISVLLVFLAIAAFLYFEDL